MQNNLEGAGNVPVETAPDEGAQALLTELARSSGRFIERSSEGIYLTAPAPVRDEAPANEPGPVEPPAAVAIRQGGAKGGGALGGRAERRTYPSYFRNRHGERAASGPDAE